MRRAQWGRRVATTWGGVVGRRGVLRRFGSVNRFPGCFGARGSKFMVNELLLDHDILHGAVTFIDRAVASLKARGASEPS